MVGTAEDPLHVRGGLLAEHRHFTDARGLRKRRAAIVADLRHQSASDFGAVGRIATARFNNPETRAGKPDSGYCNSIGSASDHGRRTGRRCWYARSDSLKR